jgi:hypothetical protein
MGRRGSIGSDDYRAAFERRRRHRNGRDTTAGATTLKSATDISVTTRTPEKAGDLAPSLTALTTRADSLLSAPHRAAERGIAMSTGGALTSRKFTPQSDIGAPDDVEAKAAGVVDVAARDLRRRSRPDTPAILSKGCSGSARRPGKMSTLRSRTPTSLRHSLRLTLSKLSRSASRSPPNGTPYRCWHTPQAPGAPCRP